MTKKKIWIDNAIKLDSNNCYRCGIEFVKGDKEKKKTFHHAIPKWMKPIANVKLAICWKCHEELNYNNFIYKELFHMLRKGFLNSQKLIEKKLDISILQNDVKFKPKKMKNEKS